MELEKISFTYLQTLKNKKIVLFGSGNIAEKTMRKGNDLNIDFIVDNSKNLQGSKFNNLEIRNPDVINEEFIVLICSTAISDISEQLINLGLKPNINFYISPILNDLLAIEKLENIKQTIFFTSGTVSKEKYGGGLYKLTINKENYNLNRIYSGPCYGAIQVENKIFFIDTDKGVFSYDLINKKLDFIKETPLKSRAHGISYNKSNNNFYITCSYLDMVIEYDNEFKEKKRFYLSEKIKQTGEPVHHCNDNYSIGNSLYVSMFSSSGNWKKDVFDGCIAEFDILTGRRLRDIVQNLYMPHNVKFYDGSLHILDSLPGHLRANNFSIIGTFSAFTRGLDYKNGFYYIGQSKNRNFSKVLGLSNNISVDCGIVIFNPEQKVSRFIPTSLKIGEIHSIICI